MTALLQYFWTVTRSFNYGNYKAGTVYKCSGEKDGIKMIVSCRLATEPTDRKVDLPDPEPPIIATTSPFETFKLTFNDEFGSALDSEQTINVFSGCSNLERITLPASIPNSVELYLPGSN